ncbi:GntR family transcriptional regulator [Alkalihalobacillus oceani]|uniref:GntR family transcriptional regulator n=1 Tax=Halalkalibacter oceani TaxID=1653776 RepID=UPI00203BFAA3|nr:GntR family transcriptional regulator [Halalkalibacter oceani]MCM3760823.1 GntR family transcriptional regulator [Halalkalibacter oceani]
MTELFQSSQPIYTQLADRIKRQILRGELLPGDKLPSVREMGIQASVNPNTVSRTYRELEGMSIVETKRGQGTFVTEDESVLTEMREELKQREISQFVKGMQEMGYSYTEIKDGLHTFLQGENGGMNR